MFQISLENEINQYNKNKIYIISVKKRLLSFNYRKNDWKQLGKDIYFLLNFFFVGVLSWFADKLRSSLVMKLDFISHPSSKSTLPLQDYRYATMPG
jgi:hypothetical protein